MLRLAMITAIAAAGCLDAFGPEVGPPLSSDGSTCDTDSNPQRTVSFANDIVNGALKRGGCKRCHLPGGDGTSQTGFDISTYATLRAGGSHSRDTIAIPGQPCTSVLYLKVSPAPPFGARMPRDASPLSIEDQQLIHDWIAEGANDN
jgi:hypothetical protein